MLELIIVLGKMILDYIFPTPQQGYKFCAILTWDKIIYIQFEGIKPRPASHSRQ